MEIVFNGFRELIGACQVPGPRHEGKEHVRRLTNGGNAYQERNAIMKPKVEKKKVLPYLSNGLRTGIESAFLLIGLTAGAFQRTLMPICSIFVLVGVKAG